MAGRVGDVGQVVGDLRRLLPEASKVTGMDALHTKLAERPEELAGGTGRWFEITAGSRKLDVLVRTEFDFGQAREPGADSPGQVSGRHESSDRAGELNRTLHQDRAHRMIAVMPTPGLGFFGAIKAVATFLRPSTTRDETVTREAGHTIEYEVPRRLHNAEVPFRTVVSVFDRGVAIAQERTLGSPIWAPMAVPETVPAPQAGGWLATGRRLPRAGVIDVHLDPHAPATHKGKDLQRPGTFDKVKSYLRKVLPRLGEEERKTIHEFLSDATVARNLQSMEITPTQQEDGASGWLDVGTLVKGANWLKARRTIRAQVQMRVVTRRYQHVEDVDGLKVTRTRREGDGVANTTSATHEKMLELAGGALGDLGVVKPAGGGQVMGSGAHAHQYTSKARNTGQDVKTTTENGVIWLAESDVEVRVVGRPPITFRGALTSYRVTTAEEARATGIVAGPDGPTLEGEREPSSPPAVLHRAMLAHTGAGERLAKLVIETLRKTPGQGEKRLWKWGDTDFLVDPDDPVVTGRLSRELAEQVERATEARRKLRDDQLGASPVTTLAFTHEGTGHTDHVLIEVTREIETAVRGDQVDGQRGPETVRSTEGTTDVTRRAKKSFGGALIGRFYFGALGITQLLDVKSGVTMTTDRSTRIGRSVETETTKVVGHPGPDGTLGSEPYRRYTGTARYGLDGVFWREDKDVVTEFRSRRAGVPEKLVFGDGSPEASSIEVDFDTLVSDVDTLIPELSRPRDPRVSEPSPLDDVAINHDGPPATDRLRRTGDRRLDGVRTEREDGAGRRVALGQELVGKVARSPLDGSQLARIKAGLGAANGFGKFSVFDVSPPPVTHGSGQRIILAESNMMLDPQELGYRRWTDTTHTVTGATVIQSRDGRQWSFDPFKVEGVLVSIGPHSGPGGAGIVEGKPVSWQTSRTAGQRAEPANITTRGSWAEPEYLVSVTKRTLQVVESSFYGKAGRRTLNRHSPAWTRLSEGPGPRPRDETTRAAHQFHEENVLVWLTADQLAAVRENADLEQQRLLLEELPFPEPGTETPQAAEVNEPPAATARTILWRPGLKLPTTPIDLTEAIPELRRALAEHSDIGPDTANRIFEPTPARSKHDNHARAEEVLANAQQHLDEAGSGHLAVPLPVAEKTSRQTYELWIQARQKGLARPGEPAPGGLTFTNRLTETSGHARGRNWTHAVVAATTFGLVTFSGEDGDVSHPGYGVGGAGGTTEHHFGVVKTETELETAGTDEQTAAISGSRERTTAELEFDLSVRRGGTVFAHVQLVREVAVDQPVEEEFSPAPPEERLGRIGDTAIRKQDVSPQALRRWHREPGHLAAPDPGKSFVEEVYPDPDRLAAIAGQGIAEGGGTVSKQVHRELAASFGYRMTKNGLLRAMGDDGLPIPVNPALGLDLVLHARPGKSARLGVPSERVEFGGKPTETTKETHKTAFTSHHHESAGLLGPIGTGLPVLPALVRPIAEGGTASKSEHTRERDNTPRTWAKPTPGETKLTGSWLEDLEFLLVAKPTAKFGLKHAVAVEFSAENAARIRRADRNDRIPSYLAEATRIFAQRDQTWNDAARRFAAARWRARQTAELDRLLSLPRPHSQNDTAKIEVLTSQGVRAGDRTGAEQAARDAEDALVREADSRRLAKSAYGAAILRAHEAVVVKPEPDATIAADRTNLQRLEDDTRLHRIAQHLLDWNGENHAPRLELRGFGDLTTTDAVKDHLRDVIRRLDDLVGLAGSENGHRPTLSELGVHVHISHVSADGPVQAQVWLDKGERVDPPGEDVDEAALDRYRERLEELSGREPGEAPALPGEREPVLPDDPGAGSRDWSPREVGEFVARARAWWFGSEGIGADRGSAERLWRDLGPDLGSGGVRFDSGRRDAAIVAVVFAERSGFGPDGLAELVGRLRQWAWVPGGTGGAGLRVPADVVRGHAETFVSGFPDDASPSYPQFRKYLEESFGEGEALPGEDTTRKILADVVKEWGFELSRGGRPSVLPYEELKSHANRHVDLLGGSGVTVAGFWQYLQSEQIEFGKVNAADALRHVLAEREILRSHGRNSGISDEKARGYAREYILAAGTSGSIEKFAKFVRNLDGERPGAAQGAIGAVRAMDAYNGFLRKWEGDVWTKVRVLSAADPESGLPMPIVHDESWRRIHDQLQSAIEHGEVAVGEVLNAPGVLDGVARIAWFRASRGADPGPVVRDVLGGLLAEYEAGAGSRSWSDDVVNVFVSESRAWWAAWGPEMVAEARVPAWQVWREVGGDDGSVVSEEWGSEAVDVLAYAMGPKGFGPAGARELAVRLKVWASRVPSSRAGAGPGAAQAGRPAADARLSQELRSIALSDGPAADADGPSRPRAGSPGAGLEPGSPEYFSVLHHAVVTEVRSLARRGSGDIEGFVREHVTPVVVERWFWETEPDPYHVKGAASEIAKAVLGFHGLLGGAPASVGGSAGTRALSPGESEAGPSSIPGGGSEHLAASKPSGGGRRDLSEAEVEQLYHEVRSELRRLVGKRRLPFDDPEVLVSRADVARAYAELGESSRSGSRAATAIEEGLLPDDGSGPAGASREQVPQPDSQTSSDQLAEIERRDDRSELPLGGRRMDVRFETGRTLPLSMHSRDLEDVDDPANESRWMVPDGVELQRLAETLDPESRNYRPEWAGLTVAQQWALLAAELRGEQFHERDREQAIWKIRILNNFGAKYPTGKKARAELEEIADLAHEKLKSWSTVTNLFPNKMVPDGNGGKVSLMRLLADGEPIRNRWETGSSGGTTDISDRVTAEWLFGYSSSFKNSEPVTVENPAEMPRYGAVIPPSRVEGSAVHYGTVVVQWNEDVRARSTFTPGDSMGMDTDTNAVTYTDKEHLYSLLAYGDDELVRHLLAEATDYRYDPSLKDAPGPSTHGFLEAQIHGPLDLSHAKKVVINWGAFGLSDNDQPNLTKAEAEQLRDDLRAVRPGLDVELGKEIGEPGRAELVERNRVRGLYGLDASSRPDAQDLEVARKLDRLAGGGPFAGHASRQDLILLLTVDDPTRLDDEATGRMLRELFEVARQYFQDPEGLRAAAPERASFFDRLVGESQPDAHPDAEPRPSDSSGYVRAEGNRVVFPAPGVTMETAVSAAAQLPVFPGVLTVGARLAADGSGVLRSDGQGVHSFAEFAGLLQQWLPESPEQRRVLLVSCYASELAASLSRFLDAAVVATRELVWEFNKGQIVAGDVRLFDDGTMLPAGPRNSPDVNLFELYKDGALAQSLDTAVAGQAVLRAGWASAEARADDTTSGDRLTEPLHWGEEYGAKWRDVRGGSAPSPENILLVDSALNHILDRHSGGSAVSGKSRFPAEWTAGDIRKHVLDVAKNPDVVPRVAKGTGTWAATGVRAGVAIEVVVESPGIVVTGYPLEGKGVQMDLPDIGIAEAELTKLVGKHNKRDLGDAWSQARGGRTPGQLTVKYGRLAAIRGNTKDVGEFGSSAFPPDWSAGRTVDRLLDVARKPDQPPRPLDKGGWRAAGTRDGMQVVAFLTEHGEVFDGYAQTASGQGVAESSRKRPRHGEEAPSRADPTPKRALGKDAPTAGSRGFTSVAELAGQLKSKAVDPRNHQSESSRTMGPDYFSRRKAPSAAGPVRGHDYSALNAAGWQALLTKLDLASTVRFGSDEYAPDRMTGFEDAVLTRELTDAERAQWAPTSDKPPLPRVLEMPRTVTSIWFGNPLPDEQSPNFRSSVARMAGELVRDSTFVHVTNVSRESVERAKDGESGKYFDDVRELVRWARDNSIILIDIYEVFNKDHPMVLQEFFEAEMARQAPGGYGAASDMARLELLKLMGGVHLDGGDRLTNVDPLDIIHAQQSFAIRESPDGKKLDQRLLAAPRNHPFLDSSLEQIRQDYLTHEGDRNDRDNAPERMRHVREIAEDSRTATLRLTQRVVHTLVWKLHSSEGKLDLTKVVPALDRHPKPELVLGAALEFVFGRPELVAMVKEVIEPGREYSVPVPRNARDLFKRGGQDGGARIVGSAEGSVPVRTRSAGAPEGARPVGSAGPESGGPDGGGWRFTTGERAPWLHEIRFGFDGGQHIIDNHAAGSGHPGKTEFPHDWVPDRLLDNVLDAAKFPDSTPELLRTGKWRARGERDGVLIEVIADPFGEVLSAFPQSGEGVVLNAHRGPRLEDATIANLNERRSGDDLAGEWTKVQGGSKFTEDVAKPTSVLMSMRVARDILETRTDGIAPSGNTTFPESWSDLESVERVLQVAHDPGVLPRLRFDGRWEVVGTRAGVEIEVLLDPDGAVWKARPRFSTASRSGEEELRSALRRRLGETAAEKLLTTVKRFDAGLAWAYRRVPESLRANLKEAADRMASELLRVPKAVRNQSFEAKLKSALKRLLSPGRDNESVEKLVRKIWAFDPGLAWAYDWAPEEVRKDPTSLAKWMAEMLVVGKPLKLLGGSERVDGTGGPGSPDGPSVGRLLEESIGEASDPDGPDADPEFRERWQEENIRASRGLRDHGDQARVDQATTVAQGLVGRPEHVSELDQMVTDVLAWHILDELGRDRGLPAWERAARVAWERTSRMRAEGLTGQARTASWDGIRSRAGEALVANGVADLHHVWSYEVSQFTSFVDRHGREIEWLNEVVFMVDAMLGALPAGTGNLTREVNARVRSVLGAVLGRAMISSLHRRPSPDLVADAKDAWDHTAVLRAEIDALRSSSTDTAAPAVPMPGQPGVFSVPWPEVRAAAERAAQQAAGIPLDVARRFASIEGEIERRLLAAAERVELQYPELVERADQLVDAMLGEQPEPEPGSPRNPTAERERYDVLRRVLDGAVSAAGLVDVGHDRTREDVAQAAWESTALVRVYLDLRRTWGSSGVHARWALPWATTWAEGVPQYSEGAPPRAPGAPPGYPDAPDGPPGYSEVSPQHGGPEALPPAGALWLVQGADGLRGLRLRGPDQPGDGAAPRLSAEQRAGLTLLVDYLGNQGDGPPQAHRISIVGHGPRDSVLHRQVEQELREHLNRYGADTPELVSIQHQFDEGSAGATGGWVEVVFEPVAEGVPQARRGRFGEWLHELSRRGPARSATESAPGPSGNIRSIAFHYSDGSPKAVAFPVGEERFHQHTHRSAPDVGYRGYTQITSDGTPVATRWMPYRGRQLAVDLHGDDGFFTVEDQATSETRRVSGRELARMVHASGAVSRGRPVLLISCDPARAESGTRPADEFADELRRMGHRGRTFAFNQAVTTSRRSDAQLHVLGGTDGRMLEVGSGRSTASDGERRGRPDVSLPEDYDPPRAAPPAAVPPVTTVPGDDSSDAESSTGVAFLVPEAVVPEPNYHLPDHGLLSPDEARYVERMSPVANSAGRYRAALTDEEFQFSESLLEQFRRAQDGHRYDDGVRDWLRRNEADPGEVRRRLNLAHVAALRVYTGLDFSLINIALRYQGIWRGQAVRIQARRLVDAMLSSESAPLPAMLGGLPSIQAVVENGSPDLKRDLYRAVDESLGEIEAEALAHGEMVRKALAALPPAKGTVWRGDRSGRGWWGKLFYRNYDGSRLFFRDLMSTSRAREGAQAFIRHEPNTRPVLLRVALHHDSLGRDISIFSAAQNENEQEVLFPAESTLDVESRRVERTGDGPELEVIGAAEARSGGSTSDRDTFHRDAGDERPRKRIFADPAYLSRAEEFETRLGAYAFGNEHARAAAEGTVRRTFEVLRAARPSVGEREILQAFGTGDATSAGQVEPLTSREEFEGFLASANLRELMTAFYSAAYLSEHPLGLKALLNGIVRERDWARAAELGLDVVSLRQQAEYLNSPGHATLRWLLRAAGKTGRTAFDQDIFASANLLARSSGWAAAIEQLRSDLARRPRKSSGPGADEYAHTPGTYRDRGAPLGEGERIFLLNNPVALDVLGFDPEQPAAPKPSRIENPRLGDLAPGEAGPELPLSWRSGEATLELRDTSGWVRQVRDERGMPVLTGISTSSARLMNAAKLVNLGVADEHLALALLGWMLPARDHTAYEILAGASLVADLPGADLSDSTTMYRSLPGIEMAAVRSDIAVDGLLPHEAAYLHRAGRHPDEGGFGAPGRLHRGLVDEKLESLHLAGHVSTPLTDQARAWLVRNGMTAPELLARFSRAHAVALSAYSQLASQQLGTGPWNPGPQADAELSNRLRRLAEDAYDTGYIPAILAANPRVMRLLDEPAPETPEEKAARRRWLHLAVDAMLPAVRAELAAHTELALEALEILPPFTGEAWGVGLVPAASGGKDVTFQGMGGFAPDESSALRMPREGAPASRAELVKVTLTGHGGRDISYFSPSHTAPDILVTPGTRFTIDRGAVTAEGAVLVAMTEVAPPPPDGGDTAGRRDDRGPDFSVFARADDNRVVFPPPGVTLAAAGAAAAQLPALPGVLTVGARLTPDGTGVLRWDRPGGHGFAEFANLLREQLPKPPAERRILLVSCDSVELAKVLSDVLDAEVIAPAEQVWQANGGLLIPGPVRIFENGEMSPAGPRNEPDSSQWLLYEHGDLRRSLGAGDAREAVLGAGWATTEHLADGPRQVEGDRLAEPIHWGDDDSDSDVNMPDAVDSDSDGEEAGQARFDLTDNAVIDSFRDHIADRVATARADLRDNENVPEQLRSVAGTYARRWATALIGPMPDAAAADANVRRLGDLHQQVTDVLAAEILDAASEAEAGALRDAWDATADIRDDYERLRRRLRLGSLPALDELRNDPDVRVGLDRMRAARMVAGGDLARWAAVGQASGQDWRQQRQAGDTGARTENQLYAADDGMRAAEARRQQDRVAAQWREDGHGLLGIPGAELNEQERGLVDELAEMLGHRSHLARGRRDQAVQDAATEELAGRLRHRFTALRDQEGADQPWEVVEQRLAGELGTVHELIERADSARDLIAEGVPSQHRQNRVRGRAVLGLIDEPADTFHLTRGRLLSLLSIAMAAVVSVENTTRGVVEAEWRATAGLRTRVAALVNEGGPQRVDFDVPFSVAARRLHPASLAMAVAGWHEHWSWDIEGGDWLLTRERLAGQAALRQEAERLLGPPYEPRPGGPGPATARWLRERAVAAVAHRVHLGLGAVDDAETLRLRVWDLLGHAEGPALLQTLLPSTRQTVSALNETQLSGLRSTARAMLGPLDAPAPTPGAERPMRYAEVYRALVDVLAVRLDAQPSTEPGWKRTAWLRALLETWFNWDGRQRVDFDVPYQVAQRRHAAGLVTEQVAVFENGWDEALSEGDAYLVRRDPLLADGELAEADRLLDVPPEPRAGLGPSAAEQQRLWQRIRAAVAAEWQDDPDAAGPLAQNLRDGFGRLHGYDELAGTTEAILSSASDAHQYARRALNAAAPERQAEVLRSAEAMVGPPSTVVPGVGPSAAAQQLHRTMLIEIVAGFLLTARETDGDVRLEAWWWSENIRQGLEYLRTWTPSGPAVAAPDEGYLVDEDTVAGRIEVVDPGGIEQAVARFERELSEHAIEGEARLTMLRREDEELLTEGISRMRAEDVVRDEHRDELLRLIGSGDDHPPTAEAMRRQWNRLRIGALSGAALARAITEFRHPADWLAAEGARLMGVADQDLPQALVDSPEGRRVELLRDIARVANASSAPEASLNSLRRQWAGMGIATSAGAVLDEQITEFRTGFSNVLGQYAIRWEDGLTAAELSVASTLEERARQLLGPYELATAPAGSDLTPQQAQGLSGISGQVAERLYRMMVAALVKVITRHPTATDHHQLLAEQLRSGQVQSLPSFDALLSWHRPEPDHVAAADPVPPYTEEVLPDQRWLQWAGEVLGPRPELDPRTDGEDGRITGSERGRVLAAARLSNQYDLMVHAVALAGQYGGVEAAHALLAAWRARREADWPGPGTGEGRA
ncbi:hypothetical protein B1H26_24155 [Amycolatopsis sp. BJA-103]|nr:hypothetical protein BKN51_20540 [Amycolatopsis sp. BJA-103]PNE16370.1 hypothetical protein B1H26_24155 [Amycolatopsis sp. BJA-103]